MLLKMKSEPHQTPGTRRENWAFQHLPVSSGSNCSVTTLRLILVYRSRGRCDTMPVRMAIRGSAVSTDLAMGSTIRRLKMGLHTHITPILKADSAAGTAGFGGQDG